MQLAALLEDCFGFGNSGDSLVGDIASIILQIFDNASRKAPKMRQDLLHVKLIKYKILAIFFLEEDFKYI